VGHPGPPQGRRPHPRCGQDHPASSSRMRIMTCRHPGSAVRATALSRRRAGRHTTRSHGG
jgi:hypothetical protein